MRVWGGVKAKTGGLGTAVFGVNATTLTVTTLQTSIPSSVHNPNGEFIPVPKAPKTQLYRPPAHHAELWPRTVVLSC